MEGLKIYILLRAHPINQGSFARHLRCMRTLYTEKQQALIESRQKIFTNIMHVPPLGGGLHLIG